MSTERDELAQIIDDRWHGYGYNPQGAADAILAAGYRKIFDGDCGLSNAAPDERDAAEAWMRWANILNTSPDEERNGIAAMRQMLTEFGYRKPRTVTTVEELDALPRLSVIRPSGNLPAVFEKHTMWHEAGSRDLVWSDAIPLPATVLHEGAPNV